MSGSTAIWATAPENQKLKIKQFHVNLWRHNHNRNALEIGLLIPGSQSVNEIYLYLPCDLNQVEFSDLFDLFDDELTLNAVFSERTSHNRIGNVINVFKASGSAFSIHSLSEDDYELLRTTQHIPKEKGFFLVLKRGFCSKLLNAGDHYLRIRFTLMPCAAQEFSDDISNEDGSLLSSVVLSEITEFRLNELRSIGSGVIDHMSGNGASVPEIHRLDYFLMRDLSFDLIVAQSGVRKLRRLEDSWENYLSGLIPAKDVSKLMIYHWRFEAKPNTDSDRIEDVVALAKFRTSRRIILFYLLTAALIGALGGFLQDLIKHLDEAKYYEALKSFGFLSFIIIVGVALTNMSRRK